MESTRSFRLGTSFRILKILGSVILVLAVCNVLGQYSRYVLGHGRLLGFVAEFDLNAANNIPTYVSSIMLLAASLLLGAIAYVVRQTKPQFALYWLGLFLLFAVMSVDEVASLHERLGLITGAFPDTHGLPYVEWGTPVMGGGFVLFGLLYMPFFFRLSSRWKKLFAASGGVYMGGALGFELVGGTLIKALGEVTFAYELVSTVEESLEMAGVALFIYALLEYLRAHVAAVHLVLGDEGDAGSGTLYLKVDSERDVVETTAVDSSSRGHRSPLQVETDDQE